MRTPNFKFDWFVPDQIIGLTHFHPAVTEEDIAEVMQKGQELTESVKREFHVLIDNRAINMPSLMSLQQMNQMAPYVNHPQLKWIVVIKPENLSIETENLAIEKDGHRSLKNVASPAEAIEFMMEQVQGIDWKQADTRFFPNSEIDGLLKSKRSG